jgi:hypothetical protein
MPPQRRAVLRLAGLCGTATLAGCSGPSDPGSEDGPSDADAVTVDTSPFVVQGSSPAWDAEDGVGRAVLIDSEERRRAVLDPYEVPDPRSDALGDFLADVDYERERLLFVESAGPNACHDRLEVTNVRLADGRIRADAAVIDTSEDDTACAEVITYPSALARIRFGEETAPSDSAAVEVTDGWGETATISVTVDDPLGPDVGSLTGAIRPETEADPLEPLACDRSNVHRHPQAFDEGDLLWGNVEQDGRVTLGLRIDDTEYEYGDTARIELTNVTDEPVYTGNSAKYNLQAHTEAGWQDVRVADEDRHFGYTDEAVEHPPGEGFEWTVELTEAGIVEGSFHDHVEVCPELAGGRYRFAFFGITDGAVAVAFDLTK